MPDGNMLSIDHFVFGAAELSAGTDWMSTQLGVPSVARGKHVSMSTHNALWRVGNAYLEVISSDRDAPAPGRPRMFGLDEPEIQTALQSRPRLLTWVASTTNLDGAIARCEHDPGPALAMSRDDLSWKLTVPEDGQAPGNGILPHLIEWPDPERSPSRALPDQGLQLAGFSATCDPHTVKLIDLMGAAHLLDISSGDDALCLKIRRPDGNLVQF